jgi:hypothetical protein
LPQWAMLWHRQLRQVGGLAVRESGVVCPALDPTAEPRRAKIGP